MKKTDKKSNSNLFLGVFLVFIGGIWLLKKLDVSLYFPNIDFSVIYEPIYNLFENFADVIFSWPMFILFIGLIMLAKGKRMGPAFTIVGVVFLIPLLFNINYISSSFILPTLLVAIGFTVILQGNSNSDDEKKEKVDEKIESNL